MRPDFSSTFITRKRKKWKFAHFDSYDNCFSLKKDGDGLAAGKQITRYFGQKRPLVLELAAGNGQFALALAQKYPSKNFIAIDIKSDRLYTSAKQALAENTDNIAFLRTHISQLEQIFMPKLVDELWLTFPDPQPKKRSAKHRLTHPTFLSQYEKILNSSGRLHFKTDNRELFLWSLEQFVAEKWRIQELSFDLHESALPDDYKIKTRYEQKFISQGLAINYLAAEPGV